MKLETQRLLVVPCTEKIMKTAIEQSYYNEPEVSFFSRVKRKTVLIILG